jgi:hypothetical protein
MRRMWLIAVLVLSLSVLAAFCAWKYHRMLWVDDFHRIGFCDTRAEMVKALGREPDSEIATTLVDDDTKEAFNAIELRWNAVDGDIAVTFVDGKCRSLSMEPDQQEELIIRAQRFFFGQVYYWPGVHVAISDDRPER